MTNSPKATSTTESLPPFRDERESILPGILAPWLFREGRLIGERLGTPTTGEHGERCLTREVPLGYLSTLFRSSYSGLTAGYTEAHVGAEGIYVAEAVKLVAPLNMTAIPEPGSPMLGVKACLRIQPPERGPDWNSTNMGQVYEEGNPNPSPGPNCIGFSPDDCYELAVILHAFRISQKPAEW